MTNLIAREFWASDNSNTVEPYSNICSKLKDAYKCGLPFLIDACEEMENFLTPDPKENTFNKPQNDVRLVRLLV
jgi:hypothetical protein